MAELTPEEQEFLRFTEEGAAPSSGVAAAAPSALNPEEQEFLQLTEEPSAPQPPPKYDLTGIPPFAGPATEEQVQALRAEEQAANQAAREQVQQQYNPLLLSAVTGSPVDASQRLIESFPALGRAMPDVTKQPTIPAAAELAAQRAGEAGAKSRAAGREARGRPLSQQIGEALIGFDPEAVQQQYGQRARGSAELAAALGHPTAQSLRQMFRPEPGFPSPPPPGAQRLEEGEKVPTAPSLWEQLAEDPVGTINRMGANAQSGLVRTVGIVPMAAKGSYEMVADAMTAIGEGKAPRTAEQLANVGELFQEVGSESFLNTALSLYDPQTGQVAGMQQLVDDPIAFAGNLAASTAGVGAVGRLAGAARIPGAGALARGAERVAGAIDPIMGSVRVAGKLYRKLGGEGRYQAASRFFGRPSEHFNQYLVRTPTGATTPLHDYIRSVDSRVAAGIDDAMGKAQAIPKELAEQVDIILRDLDPNVQLMVEVAERTPEGLPFEEGAPAAGGMPGEGVAATATRTADDAIDLDLYAPPDERPALGEESAPSVPRAEGIGELADALPEPRPDMREGSVWRSIRDQHEAQQALGDLGQAEARAAAEAAQQKLQASRARLLAAMRAPEQAATKAMNTAAESTRAAQELAQRAVQAQEAADWTRSMAARGDDGGLAMPREEMQAALDWIGATPAEAAHLDDLIVRHTGTTAKGMRASTARKIRSVLKPIRERALEGKRQAQRAVKAAERKARLAEREFDQRMKANEAKAQRRRAGAARQPDDPFAELPQATGARAPSEPLSPPAASDFLDAVAADVPDVPRALRPPREPQLVPVEDVGRAHTMSDADIAALSPAAREHTLWLRENVQLADVASGKVQSLYMVQGPGALEPMVIGQLSEAADLATDIRNTFMEYGARAAKLGFLPEQTFWARMHEYFPDLYKQYERAYREAFGQELTAGKLSANTEANLRERELVGNRFKRRKLKDLTQEERDALGRIRDPRYVTASGLSELIHDVQYGEMLEQLAKSTITEGPAQGLPFARPPSAGKTDTHPYQLKSRAKRGRYQRGVKGFGSLEGHYVPDHIGKYLEAARSIPSDAERLYLRWLTRWKLGNTALNPATHLRNWVDLFATADRTGLNVASPAAMRSLRGLWDEARTGKGWSAEEFRAAGGERTGFAQTELLRDLGRYAKGDPFADLEGLSNPVGAAHTVVDWLLQGVERLKRSKGVARLRAAAQSTGGKAIDLYAFPEDLFRRWKFRQVRTLQNQFAETGRVTWEAKRVLGPDVDAVLNAKGDAALRAMEQAEKVAYNYADSSPFVNIVRKYWQPFISYTAKALPQMGEFLARHPVKAMVYRNTFDTLNIYSTLLDGEPPPEGFYADQELRKLTSPQWRSRGGMVYGGTRRFEQAQGGESPLQAMVQDMQFWTSAGGLYESPQQYAPGLVPKLVEPSNPAVTTPVGMHLNLDPWREKPIISDVERTGMTAGDVLAENLMFAGRQFAPNLLGRGIPKLAAAMGDPPKPDYAGRIRTPGEVAGDVLGGVRFDAQAVGGAIQQVQQDYGQARQAVEQWLRGEMRRSESLHNPEAKAELIAEFQQRVARIDAEFNARMRETLERAERQRAAAEAATGR